MRIAFAHPGLVLGVCILIFGSSTVWADDGSPSGAPIDETTDRPSSKVGEQGLRQLSNFLTENCLDCHQGDSAEANLDMDQLSLDLSSAATLDRWVTIHDRVESHEMPPPEAAELGDEDIQEFLSKLSKQIRSFQLEQYQKVGRVPPRRLTNLQLERTLHDLLGIDIPLEAQMPEEPTTGSYSTRAALQSMSHFQLEQHLKVVDLALDEAFRRALHSRDDLWQREMSAKRISRTRTRTREPEYIDGAAVIWSSTLSFYGRIPATTAKEDGWYRFRFQVSALKKPSDHGVWCTVRSGQCVSSAPLMAWVGAFEADSNSQEIVVEAWLPKGHMLEIRPGDRTLKMARFQGGQSANGEGGRQNVPGIKIDWLTMERFHHRATDDDIRKFLFGSNLQPPEFANAADEDAADEDAVTVAQDLIHDFATRAFRRPLATAELERFTDLFRQSASEGESFSLALRAAYRGILCSSRFLYFHELPGPLDDYAIASRLSYALWNSMPDAELFDAAEQQRLSDPAELRHQVERMLQSDRGRQFMDDFAAEWLELSEIDFTEPDRRMYPDFDSIVQNSMLAETRSFLQHMLSQNIGIDQLIASDFTFLDSRLARYYDIPGVQGDNLRRVTVPAGSSRGGVLTQGAILKVTANGTNTSPVVRGVWVSERLLGTPIPPPPDNVSAIEPDIRGAKSIREQLALHRNNEACFVCHAKIDPPGFALENFDAAGQWRTHYPRIERGRARKGLEIDPSYEMADGQKFSDFEQFRSIVAKDTTRLAQNFASHLLEYSTGAAITFADRSEIDRIVSQAEADNFGMRSIVHATLASSIFLTK